MKPVLKTKTQVKATSYSRVLPMTIQNQTAEKIEVRNLRLAEIVRAFGNVDNLTDSQLRELANKLRHEGSNYDSLINTDWYQNAREIHGEYMYFYLKSEISQRISLALDGLAARYGVRIDALEAANKALKAELEVAKNDIKALSSVVSELISEAKATNTVLNETRVELNETRVELNEAAKEIKSLRTTVVELEEENEILAERVERLEETVNEFCVYSYEKFKNRIINNRDEAERGQQEVDNYLHVEVKPTVAKLSTATETEKEEKVLMIDESFKVLDLFLVEVSKFVDTTLTKQHLQILKQTVNNYRKQEEVYMVQPRPLPKSNFIKLKRK